MAKCRSWPFDVLVLERVEITKFVAGESRAVDTVSIPSRSSTVGLCARAVGTKTTTTARPTEKILLAFIERLLADTAPALPADLPIGDPVRPTADDDFAAGRIVPYTARTREAQTEIGRLENTTHRPTHFPIPLVV